jgi:hypothetical protein
VGFLGEWRRVLRLDFRIRLTFDMHTIRTHSIIFPMGIKHAPSENVLVYRAAETCIRTFLVLRIANQTLLTAFLKINGDPFHNSR